MAKKLQKVGIVGHPNCKPGECYDTCHNVACAIYQGFEDPEYIEEEIEQVEEKK